MKRLAKAFVAVIFSISVLVTGVSAASATALDISISSGTVPNTYSTYADGVAYGNGHWVALGHDLQTYGSTDGKNWTTGGTLTFYPRSITYGEGKFVAMFDRTVAISTDNGASWTEHQIDVSNSNWFSRIAYGDGYFVITEFDDCIGKVAYSTDAINWTLATTESYGVCWNYITHGNGKFVIVGSDRIEYSTDHGATWHIGSQGQATSGFASATYTSGKWVALTSPDNGRVDVYTSVDATSWTLQTHTNTLDGGAWSHLRYANGLLVAASRMSTDPNELAYSTDEGSTWTAISQGGFSWQGLAYGNGRWVLAGEFSGQTPPTGRTSSPLAWFDGLPDSGTSALANTGSSIFDLLVVALIAMLIIGAGSVLSMQRKP